MFIVNPSKDAALNVDHITRFRIEKTGLEYDLVAYTKTLNYDRSPRLVLASGKYEDMKTKLGKILLDINSMQHIIVENGQIDTYPHA